jgi:hypothetical protein
MVKDVYADHGKNHYINIESINLKKVCHGKLNNKVYGIGT